MYDSLSVRAFHIDSFDLDSVTLARNMFKKMVKSRDSGVKWIEASDSWGGETSDSWRPIAESRGTAVTGIILSTFY